MGTPQRIRKPSSMRIGGVILRDEPTSPRGGGRPDAEVGFRLADPYRPGGIYAVPWQQQLAACRPVPLTKSASAPADLRPPGERSPTPAPPSDEDAFPLPVTVTPDGSPTMASWWRCRGCGATDPNLLTESRESELVCECGVVSGRVPVAACRQKACAREEDKTQVADHQGHDAESAALRVLVDGGSPETAHERRRRLLRAAGGGGRIRRGASDLAKAQARVDTATLQGGVRERIDGDSKLAKKRRAVLRVVEAVFDQFGPTLNQAVARHIRLEAVRILGVGMAHAEACCGEEHCQIAIGSRSNALLAVCTVQACLEDLTHTAGSPNDRHNPRGPTLAEVAPDCSAQELAKHLERVRELKMQGSGGAQRAQVAAAVGIVMGWTRAQMEHPCCAPARPASAPALPLASPPSPVLPHFALPPQLQLALGPVAVAAAAAAAGDDGAATPPGAQQQQQQDVVWSVRDLIHGASVLANVRTAVRTAALSAISKDCLANWIRTQNVLPVEVLSVAILAAAASKLGAEDTTGQLLEHYCFQNHISPTTARSAAETVASMMVVDPSTPAGLFADGIF